ncbi:MAG: hypothetical protein DWQ36_02545 [Acidobacteria bacterium]|nr:MAG: hypothetical protein DWQ36_02545 [Acidobacteriota bacterium]
MTRKNHAQGRRRCPAGRPPVGFGRTRAMATSLVCALALWSVSVAAAAAARSPAEFRILTEEAGVLRLGWEDIVRAAPGLDPPRHRDLALRNQGHAVPFWVDDSGGDGRFGPGDSLLFVGEQLGQDGRHHHDIAEHNVYWLSLRADDGWLGTTVESLAPPSERAPRGGPDSAARPGTGLRAPIELVRSLHLEEDNMMIRLSERQMTGGWGSDLWFWEKLTHRGTQRSEVSLDLSDRDPESRRPLDLRIGLRALNQTATPLLGDLPGHRVEVVVDGATVGAASWNGAVPRILEISLDPAALPIGPTALQLVVPSRVPRGLDDPIVDVVMVNWIEASYAVRPELDASTQKRVFLDASGQDRDHGPLAIEIGPGGALELFLADGRRRIARPGAPLLLAAEEALRLSGRAAHLVADGAYGRVAAVEADRPSRLRDSRQRADYLMISHPRLLDAVRPLAEFHQGRGLEVELIDVQDVYDEFSHGIVSLEAIRDFVRHTQLEWRQPAPRFVLLVGDASWDVKSEVPDDRRYANYADREFNPRDGEFSFQQAPRYTHLGGVAHRNLIPTAMYASSQGHAASDNYFVSVLGDDLLPDLAIGRLPLVDPEEVAAVVKKTIAYAEAPEVGPWRADVLWITNEQRHFQTRTDRLADDLLAEGLAPAKVYPQPEEGDNALHQARLQAELDDGKLLVHFLGHGGRFIWRTGPPDIHKNHDLFTPEHIDELEPTGRLPVVLSMTCFSAPFDHPDADSIGEKFLRTPDRGAVAVFAASWRNSPSQRYSEALVEWLTRPGMPIGTAILRAKQEIRGRDLIETYNLLGDPAIPLALPQQRLELRPVAAEDGAADTADAVAVAVDLPFERFEGSARVRWLDRQGVTLRDEVREVGSESFQASWDASREGTPGAVQVYVWSPAQGLDAYGAVTLPDRVPAPVASGLSLTSSELP